MSLSVCQTLRQSLVCSLATASRPLRPLVSLVADSSTRIPAAGPLSRSLRAFEGRQVSSKNSRFLSPVYMATHESAEAGSKSVLVPIANGTEEMEADIVIDILRRAGKHSIGVEDIVTRVPSFLIQVHCFMTEVVSILLRLVDPVVMHCIPHLQV